jgi:hypothetical protein
VIRECGEPGCTTLTLGPSCIAHEVLPLGPFPRGRPWPPRPEEDERDAVAPLSRGVAGSVELSAG